MAGIHLKAEALLADRDGDGDADTDDLLLFMAAFGAGDPSADIDGSGTVTVDDLLAYLGRFRAGSHYQGRGAIGLRSSPARAALRHGYAGYLAEQDLEGTTHLVRHRWLLSEFGQWNKRDPLGYVDGMGLYAYVKSRPLSLADPQGLAACSAGGKWWEICTEFDTYRGWTPAQCAAEFGDCERYAECLATALSPCYPDPANPGEERRNRIQYRQIYAAANNCCDKGFGISECLEEAIEESTRENLLGNCFTDCITQMVTSGLCASECLSPLGPLQNIPDGGPFLEEYMVEVLKCVRDKLKSGQDPSSCYPDLDGKLGRWVRPGLPDWRECAACLTGMTTGCFLGCVLD